MKRWIIFSLIVLSVLLVFGIPLVVDWLIIANDVPSNISNFDWVGFLGGYIGAIVGGIISLIGIGVSIRIQDPFSLNVMIFYDDILGNHYVKRVKLLNQ